ncbi:MAG: hypothetical protein ACJ8ED_05315, partial [Xanthobacteraceae bacterium]
QVRCADKGDAYRDKHRKQNTSHSLLSYTWGSSVGGVTGLRRGASLQHSKALATKATIAWKTSSQD